MLNYIPVPEAGCWLWAGAWDVGGYGVVSLGSRRNTASAHRTFYAEANGPIPAGMCVCHKCDTPCCVNPDHLFLGTHADNMRDMWNKGRSGVQRAQAKRVKAGKRPFNPAGNVGGAA